MRRMVCGQESKLSLFARSTVAGVRARCMSVRILG